MKKIIIQILVLLILISCSLTGRGDKLDESDLRYLENLGLLDKNENVLFFTSSLSIKRSGDFITNKRVASYWIDKDESKTFKDFAYYQDIIKIDSVNLTQAWTNNSYLKITRKDGSSFNVYINDDNENYQTFVEIANENWKLKK
jgi:hypothetical protein